MPKLNDLYPSKWLKAEDCEDEDLILTIDKVVVEPIGQGAQIEQKPVVYFLEEDKGLVLNKTNAKTIGKIHGDDTDGWPGKRVALFAMEVEYQGDMMLGIRVRMKEPKKGKPIVPRPAREPESDKAVAVGEESDGDDDLPF